MRPDETFGSRSTEEIGNALQSLVNTATPHDRARSLREQSHLVLTDKAVELLNSNIQRASERADAEAVGVFEHVCSLVKLARSQGLDAVIASLEHEDLLNTLRPFIECSAWSERKTMLETNSDVLLGESARKVLQELLEINEDPHAISLLQALSALLTVARRSGIQEGFVWLQNQLLANLAKAVGEGQHDNAALLIKELQGITDRDDWVELNSRVIDVVTEHTQQIDNRDWLFELMREELAAAPTPLSRAALAVRLGSSFANPDNEEHITQSIAWLRQSLEAFESTGYSFRGVYGTLGRAFLVKESGDREGNLLTAHDYLQRELQTLDRTVDPASWAITQRLLGRVLMLLNRREPAIEHLAASLDEEPDGLDEGYAQAGLNLARLRLKEQGPGRQTAIEQAIADLQRAVVKAPENSRLWARIESVLGNIYRQRKSGDPAANFEQGFYHENQALRVFTRKLFPNEWAQVQHNLGTLYSTDIRGDRSDNIERAIVCYHNVLRVHTKEAYPQYYGLTSSALGFAMIERSAGVREQNLEDALHLLKEAEGTLDPKESATWLAECRNGIGMLYSERLSGDERQNLLQAAEYFELSRNAYHDLGDKERERIGFSNLAAVYTRLGNFDPDAKVKGIRYAQQALEGTGQDTDPYDWAMFNRNLGAAILSQEVTTANLNQALGCLSNALKVFRPDTYLAEYRVSQKLSWPRAFPQPLVGARVAGLPGINKSGRTVAGLRLHRTRQTICRARYRVGPCAVCLLLDTAWSI